MVTGPACGSYQLRVSAKGLDQGHAEEFADQPVNAYLLQLWPALPQPDRQPCQDSDSRKYRRLFVDRYLAIALRVPSSGHARRLHWTVTVREDHGAMTAPTVEAAIHELMDLAWNVVYHLLDERGLLGDGLFVEEYTGIHSWVDDLTRYTVVHSHTVAVLFVDIRPVDAIAFHHDLLGADDPKSFFTVTG